MTHIYWDFCGVENEADAGLVLCSRSSRDHHTLACVVSHIDDA